MPVLWTAPYVWGTKEPITKKKLNDMNNNINYLFAPQRKVVTIRGTGADAAITSTTPIAIDSAALQIRLELSGLRDVWVEMEALGQNNTIATVNRFDVLIDGTTYLSSLTGTQLANGLKVNIQHVAAQAMEIAWRFVLPAGVLVAGVHTFEPMAWVSAGTLTVILGVNGLAQFRVGEY